MAGQTETRRLARDPAVAVWTVAGLCWTATVALTVLGGQGMAGHDQIIEHDTGPWALRIGGFVLGWTVMVAAMMLPSTVAMTRLFTAVSARAPHPYRARATLFAVYLAVWLGFGLVALAGDTTVHAVVDRLAWLHAHEGVVEAGLLAVAGAAQFSPIKDRCLTACRDPLSMLWQHYRRGAGAWRVAWHHALNCLGCCWGLMLVMFGVGVGNLGVMLGLTAVMVAEKITRWGRRLVAPVGVLLLVAAVVEGFGARA